MVAKESGSNLEDTFVCVIQAMSILKRGLNSLAVAKNVTFFILSSSRHDKRGRAKKAACLHAY